MKIGILTLPLHTNYGGILQAYAMQTVLQRLGHEVEVFQKKDYYAHKAWVMPLVYLKRVIKKYILGQNLQVFYERNKNKEKKIIEQETSKFIHKYIRLRNINEFSEIQRSDYDAILVGSDQVWRKPYFVGLWHQRLKEAFLSFTKGWNIKRYSYAASFGVGNLDEYKTEERDECKELLRQFDMVSVREASGVRICKEAFNLDALHLLDPTMLLSKDDYNNLILNSTTTPSQGDALCYILDMSPFKKKVISEICSSQKFTPFYTNSNAGLHDEIVVQPPVEQWLRGFLDAKVVITDSFHACVFSILFEKQFVVINNNERGMERIISLLKEFHLEDRLIYEDQVADISQLLNSSIRPGVTDKLETLRIKAMNYLSRIE